MGIALSDAMKQRAEPTTGRGKALYPRVGAGGAGGQWRRREWREESTWEFREKTNARFSKLMMIRHRHVVNRGNRKIFREYADQATKVPTNVQWQEIKREMSGKWRCPSVDVPAFAGFVTDSHGFLLDVSLEFSIFWGWTEFVAELKRRDRQHDESGDTGRWQRHQHCERRWVRGRPYSETAP